MMKMERPQQPNWLKENYKKWGRKFKKKLNNPNLKNDFIWAIHHRTKVNVKLLPILRNATFKHCAFCDDKIKKGTIEHFRPSSDYPRLSYAWYNLFPACSDCQEKNSEFKGELLKPDKEDYEFLRYYLYNATSGEIEANPKANEQDQTRAKTTIEIYKLNRPELIEDRMDCFENYKDVAADKRPFRFVFIRKV
ncbi:MAG: TIGR02646 family protein [Pyrinomonadaceae bacterium]|nr:TIGR02646 family protein [Pyrinomonadaceae bacterium]